MNAYVKLGIAALFPVIATILLYILDAKTKFGKIDSKIKQIIYGVIFGGLAILGTEWGIPINGAQTNCRDAAVLIAGLLFGAPAGIIAGVIGGVERWIAVAWGVGSFTRIACTVSTIIAGIYAALLRKFMFRNHRPGTLIALAIGFVMEVFHITMVFITNMNSPIQAMAVVQAVTIPMVLANGVSVMLAALVINAISKKKLIAFKKNSEMHISQTIQQWLLVTVTLAFLVTTYFVYSMQNTLAISQMETSLTNAVQEVVLDVEDASDASLITVTKKIANELENETNDLEALAKKYEVAEISFIDTKGIIVESTDESYVGFDMGSGEQSAEFLKLLTTEREYVQNYGPITSNPSIYRKYAGVRSEGGFVQVGYDAEMFQRDIEKQVTGFTKNRHVGSTGFILIFDKKFNVISTPEYVPIAAILGKIGQTAAIPSPGSVFETSLGKDKYYCYYEESEGYYIASFLPSSEAFQIRNIALYVNIFMEILVFAILFALVYILIDNVIVKRLDQVNNSLTKITNGNLDVSVDVNSNLEFKDLSKDINMTVSTLKKYIDEAAKRIDTELEFAKNIQTSALPSVFPAFPNHKEFDIYATMHTAKEVGGDFYDLYMTDTNTLNFLIADVSGKGIPAAMFMMRAKTELKSLTETGLVLNEVFTRGNAALCEGNDAGMFVTAWQCNIGIDNGTMRYVNAGHNPPLIKRNGKFEYLKSPAGFILAGMDGVKYKINELKLMPGDVVYLYTDGVTEATNKNEELFGEERLLEVLNNGGFANMSDICRKVKEAVDEFVGEAPQFDDITMVAFEYKGVPTIHFDAAEKGDIEKVTEFVEAELEKLECPMKVITQINIAIDEIFSNIVIHGYEGKKGPATVRVISTVEPRGVYIRFSDKAQPYNPLVKEDPDISLPADKRGIGGLGIYMVKQMMDDMKYKYENGENILTIYKKY